MTLKIISFTLVVAFQSSKWVKMNRTQVGYEKTQVFWFLLTEENSV